MSRGQSVTLALLITLVITFGVGAWMWDRFILGNRTFSFYGQLVDPQGNGISGGVVSLRVTRIGFWSYPVPLIGGGTWNIESTTTDVVSDHAGDFSLTGCRGTRLDVTSIIRDGYIFENNVDVRVGRLSPVRTWFDYNQGGVWLPSSPARRAMFTLTPIHPISAENSNGQPKDQHSGR